MRYHNVPRDMQRHVQRWYDYAWSRSVAPPYPCDVTAHVTSLGPTHRVGLLVMYWLHYFKSLILKEMGFEIK